MLAADERTHHQCDDRHHAVRSQQKRALYSNHFILSATVSKRGRFNPGVRTVSRQSAQPEWCFACERAAVGREHVPPACLFPEGKDSPARVDMRRDLITVPSCEYHNLRKSRDDEYFLWVLSTNLPANGIAQTQVSTKLARAYRRRPALGQAMLHEAKDAVVFDSRTGAAHEAIEVPLDAPRFQKVLDLIVLGLYRHHFNARWLGSIRVHPDFIAFPDSPDPLDLEATRIGLFEAAEVLFANSPKHGANPDVFWYQVLEAQDLVRCIIRLNFYGGCTATAFVGPLSS